MKRTSLFLLFFGLSSFVFSQTSGDYRSNAAGAWTTASTWQIYNGSGWVAATSSPTGAAGVTITIVSGKNVTGTPALTLAGNLVINSGAQLTIANPSTGSTADFTVSSTGSITNNGTMLFTAGTSGNLTRLVVDGAFTNAGTVNMNTMFVNLTVGGTLTNSNSFSISATNDALTINGTFTNTGSFTISNVSNTVVTVNGTVKNSNTFTSPGAAKLVFSNGSVYQHLFTTSAGNIPSATWGTTSTCLISGYTTNTTLPGNLSSSFGNFTWNTPLLAQDFNLAAQLKAVHGTLTIASTGSGTLYLSKLSTEPLPLTVDGDFIISGTAKVNITQDAIGNSITIGGNFTHSSASVLTAASGTGSADFSIAGNLSSTGFNAGTGTLAFDGAGAQAINGTINAGNISINNAVGVNVEGTVNLTGTLTLNNPTDIFDADGTSDSGTLTLLSTASNPVADAAIAAIPAGAIFQGKVTVQRYMNGLGSRQYRYISSPVTNATVASWQDDFSITGSFTGTSTTEPSTGTNTVCGYPLTKSASMYYYNEATKAYVAYPTTNSSASLVPARGYAAFIRDCSSATVIDVTGPINQGDLTLNSSSTPSITYNKNGKDASMYGYNLVGNPYPSALDWESSAWSLTNISSVIAISDNSSGSLVYHYMDNSDASGDDFIATGQAFWVRATAASPVLQFSEDVKALAGSSITFYRKASPLNDKLVIKVTNGTIEDKAYVKINPAAKATLDEFDGPKMDNTLFDLSTLSSDNTTMAINAISQIQCGDQIKINLKDFTAGSYTLSFESAGLLNAYDLILTDKYLSKTANVSQNPSYTFSVNSAAASKAADRFVITLSPKTVALDLAVDTDVKVCGDASGTVKVYNTQAGVDYYATINNVTIGSVVEGGDSYISLPIPSASLMEGENTVVIKAQSGCSTAALTQTALVIKSTVSTSPAVTSSLVCTTGTVTLTASAAPKGGNYNWYTAADATAPVFTGAEFTTPVLTQSTTYYTSIVDYLGCEGARVPATATVKNYSDVVITATAKVLQSNYTTGNRWYLNDVLQADTSAIFHVKSQGTYRLEVVTSGCILNSTNNVVITDEELFSDKINSYPNPVQSVFSLEIPAGESANDELAVIDNVGKQVGIMKLVDYGSYQLGKYDFSKHPAGIYLIRVISRSGVRQVKVVRE